MLLEFAIEDYSLGIFALIILVLVLFFMLVNKQRPLERKLKTPKQETSQLLLFVIKSIAFFVITWLLNHLFDVFIFFDQERPSTGTVYFEEAKINNPSDAGISYFDIIFSNLTNFDWQISLEHIVCFLIFSSIYVYFNAQMGFAAIFIALFSLFKFLESTNFLLSFVIISFSVLLGFLSFKIKKKFIDKIRVYFSNLETNNKFYAVKKSCEFYLICSPYMIYSGAFCFFLLGGAFNLLIHLLLSHLFSYLVIFKLYKSGHDMGLDYDPF
jgi:hypothetical protein